MKCFICLIIHIINSVNLTSFYIFSFLYFLIIHLHSSNSLYNDLFHLIILHKFLNAKQSLTLFFPNLITIDFFYWLVSKRLSVIPENEPNLLPHWNRNYFIGHWNRVPTAPFQLEYSLLLFGHFCGSIPSKTDLFCERALIKF